MAKLCSIVLLLALGIICVYSQPIEKDYYRQPDAALNVIERIRRDQRMSGDKRTDNQNRATEILTGIAETRLQDLEQQAGRAELELIRIAEQYEQNQRLTHGEAMVRARANRRDLANIVDNYRNSRQG